MKPTFDLDGATFTLFNDLTVTIPINDWQFLCKNRWHTDDPDIEDVITEFVTGTGITPNKPQRYSEAGKTFHEYVDELRDIMKDMENKKQIHLSNPRYGVTGFYYIDKTVYEKHYQMHKNRPEEALQNELSIIYGLGTPVTSEMIENVINEEYDEAKNLNKTIEKAAEKAAKDYKDDKLDFYMDTNLDLSNVIKKAREEYEGPEL